MLKSKRVEPQQEEEEEDENEYVMNVDGDDAEEEDEQEEDDEKKGGEEENDEDALYRERRRSKRERRRNRRKIMEDLEHARMSYRQMLRLIITDYPRFKLKRERWNVLLIHLDLFNQQSNLKESLLDLDEEIAPLQKDFDSNIPKIRKLICEHTLKMTKGKPFSRPDVENMMSANQIGEIVRLKQVENKIYKMNQTRLVVLKYYNEISAKINECDTTLEDMRLIRTLESAGDAVRFAHGLDLEEFRTKMVNVLERMTSHIGIISKNQEQQMDVDIAKSALLNQSDDQSAIDLLFRDAAAVVVATATASQEQQPQRRVAVRD